MLYIVATPIGNLKEMTFRAVETLKTVDYILCEDTRTSLVLLNEFGVKNKLVSYHKFNETQMLENIISDLMKGLNLALISDAGMPLISDPGAILVNKLIELGLEYTVISGPTAFVNAFVLSGYSYPFTFYGFLPNKPSDRKEVLKELKDNKHTLIFYSSPYDLKKDLKDLYNVLGDREICIVRELTKKFEQVNHSTLEQGYDGILKGEFVVLIDRQGELESPLNQLTIEEHLDFYINLGYKKQDAIEIVAKERKIKKNEVYKFSYK